jgi:hypothetical protein
MPPKRSVQRAKDLAEMDAAAANIECIEKEKAEAAAREAEKKRRAMERREEEEKAKKLAQEKQARAAKKAEEKAAEAAAIWEELLLKRRPQSNPRTPRRERTLQWAILRGRTQPPQPTI